MSGLLARRLVVLLAGVLGGVTRLQAQPAASSPQRFLEQLHARELQDPSLPGCATEVAVHGITLASSARGMASLELRVPLHSGSRFYVGSISKQFTAFALARLAQQGALSLDDDVRRHLPELPQWSQGITIRHLLHQSHGFYEFSDWLALAGARPGHVTVFDDVMGLAVRQRQSQMPSGASYLSNNTGFVLAGEIVRRASGKSLGDFLRDSVWVPLRMHHTSVPLETDKVEAELASGYAALDSIRVARRRHPTAWVAGPASVVTTTSDLMLWLAAWHARGGGTAQWYETMESRMVGLDGSQLGYGLALVHGTTNGRRYIGHSGAEPGFMGTALLFPESGVSVATLCNRDGAPSGRIAIALATFVMDSVLTGVRGAAAPATPSSPSIAGRSPAAANPSWSGTYWSRSVASALEVKVEATGVSTSLTGAQPLSAGTGAASTWLQSVDGAWRIRWQDANTVCAESRGSESRCYRRVPSASAGPASIQRHVGSYWSEELRQEWRIVSHEGRLRLDHPRLGSLDLEEAHGGIFRSGTWHLEMSGSRGRTDSMFVSAPRARNLLFVRR